MPQDITVFLADMQRSFEQFCSRWNGHGNFERNAFLQQKKNARHMR